MPPQSRGADLKPPAVPAGLQSRSTPSLSTLKSLKTGDAPANPDRTTTISPDESVTSADNVTSPSEPASIEDFSLDPTREPVQLPSPGISGDEGDGAGDGDEEEAEEEEEEEDGPVANLPALGRSVSQHQHSRSHTYLAPLAFAPPFYNRPQTPLPPSPSLTSLLRPTFSSQNSRPTTPDPSSDEGGTAAGIPRSSSSAPPHARTDPAGAQTPNSAAASTLTSSLRTARPVPRASPRVPTYEYYGFTLYLTASLAFTVYLLWAYLPSPILHQLGIHYYPNRWWALAIPAWSVMLGVYVYVALAAYNVGYLTLALGDVGCFVDEAASVAVVDERGRLVRSEGFLQFKGGGVSSPERRHGNGGAGRKGVSSSSSAGGGGARGRHSRQNSLTRASPAQGLEWRRLWNEGTDAVMDIPVGGVCEVLYGGGRGEGEDDGDHDDDECVCE